MNQDQQAQPTGAQQEAAGQVELVRLDATQTWNADSKLVAFFGGEAAKRVAECSADGVWTVHDEAEFKRLNPAFHALWKQNERQAAEIERLGGLLRDCEAAFAEYQCVVSSVNDPTSFAPKIKDEGNIARKMMKRIRAELDGK